LRDWGIFKLPEIKDEDLDLEDGYNEFETSEIEEDQISCKLDNA